MDHEKIAQAQLNLVAINRQAAAEGMVLLRNQAGMLPLTAKDTVSLFGRCQINTYRSGTGSGGAVNVPYYVNYLQGLRENPVIQLNESLVDLYEQWLVDHPFDNGGGGWAAEPWFQQEMPLTEEVVARAAKQSNKAIVFIGRTAGEDKDYAETEGSYLLTELELRLLNQVTAHFDSVAVILNVTNIIDMSWLESLENATSIKAVLYSWAAGMEGGHALADVLSGNLAPSGRLTDTIARRLADYPSSANFGRTDYNLYEEDIYLGYRYFETFKRDAVMFPFGAGLSYTSFSRQLVRFAEEHDKDRALLFDVEVCNIGSQYSAKEVVQLYVQAPQGLLGKPSRVLIGFAKTDTLQPGQSQTLCIRVPLSYLASYDDSGATGARFSYVLEAGQYHFYLGGNVREAELVAESWSIDDLLVVERLQQAAAPVCSFNRLKPGARLANGQFEPIVEPAPMRDYAMKDRIASHMPPTISMTGDKGYKLADVQAGNVSLEAFIAQLTAEQLATLVRGEGMCSPKVTPGTASAFGGVSDELFGFGIPVAAAADGPSGIRMDSGHKATQVPIGTLLSCSWNAQLNERLFRLIGEELRANHIDTLLGPGVNIHRHPLNGRNFEYFSEDPLMTGVMAAAQVRGLEQAGVTGTIKHFAANDQETARTLVDSVMSERALREIHIKPFEMAVKDGGARSIMTAYNPVNGHWAASNYDLNTTILRGEWGYTGIVMTDWWAKMNDPIDAGGADKSFTSFMIRAQNDLYMVVENDGAARNAMNDNTLAALSDGTLTLGELQRCALNICRFILAAPVMQRPLKAYEPVKLFIPLGQQRPASSFDISEPVSLNTSVDGYFDLWVAEPGTYQVQASVVYDRDAQAQSTCSLSFNGDFSMTLSVNGTQGKEVNVEGLPVRLETGHYRLDTVFVKPGLVLSALLFKRQ